MAPALAQNFPAFTGRVVDPAGVIAPGTRSEIEARLQDLQTRSGIQLIVATVPSLGGQEIEPYANQLFRSWKLGDKDRNDGVLLLVSTGERKIRIEVGYGLEATLTDAISKLIIVNTITPSLRNGDFGGGISRGVDDIIAVLTSDAAQWSQRPTLAGKTPWDSLAFFGIFGLFALLISLFIIGGNIKANREDKGKSGHWIRTKRGRLWVQGADPGGARATSSSWSSSGSNSSSSSSSGGGSSDSSSSGGGGSSGDGGASGDY